MLELDHLTVIAPSLQQGLDHVRGCLDLDIPDGVSHPTMGTHNRRLRLGETTYLEVIAVDPSAAAPSGPRWFGFERPDAVRADWEAGVRLRAWVARCDDIAAIVDRHRALFGEAVRIDREARFSLLADGRLPKDGALPSLIDRGNRPLPTARMPDVGVRLREVILAHPHAAEIRALYGDLGIGHAPTVDPGDALRYRATIATPSGLRLLT